MTNTNLTSVDQVKDLFYREEFQKILDSNETYKGKWNWWAFLFTGIWAAVKGCWGLFFLILVSSMIVNFFLPSYDIPIAGPVFLSFALPHIVWGLIMGWRGTWFYYLSKVKNKVI